MRTEKEIIDKKNTGIVNLVIYVSEQIYFNIVAYMVS